MTEQTVRERFKHRANGFMDSEYHRDDEDIDKMLDIIRTALLSEPAVDAAAYQMDVLFGEATRSVQHVTLSARRGIA